ncbi:MAG: metallophosphoesterase [Armatimonadota bacterium]|jgi:2',3'-cyclic-nucleotide 2'-phosphodiesterase (5'-nucleotidase family)
MAQLTIFHTSDLHNKLTESLACNLRDLKSQYPNSLMLDSGDAIWAGNIFWRPGGEPILDLMNTVPYDSMCMGNREYHFLSKGLTEKTSRANFPILSANLRSVNPAYTTAFSGIKESVTIDVGFRVTIFGLTVPCITESMRIKRIAHQYFVDPIEAAADLAPRLRAECDLLIALTHIGLDKDRELAHAAPDIDIILGGHTHTVEESEIGNTKIFHSGAYAKSVRKIDVELDAGAVTLTSELIPMVEA